jgi:hypothetical protein
MPVTVRLPVPEGRPARAIRAVVRAAVDHERLRRLALGVESSELRAHAILELGRSDAPTRARDLETVLADTAAALRHRHLAATLLGRIDSPVARLALAQALATADPRLAGAIARSLGRIGDRAALKALVKASASLAGVPLAQARFAMRLIAHRLDLALPELPDAAAKANAAPPEALRPFQLAPAGAVEVQMALRALAHEPFGIELDGRSAHAIRCDGSQAVLFMNRDLDLATDVRRLLTRKALAGVVARRADGAETYSASLVILTSPDAEGKVVSVTAHQTSGTLTLIGSARPRGEGLSFELRGVQRRGGFAARLEGILAGSAIVLDTARVASCRDAVGRPIPRRDDGLAHLRTR